jgi:hypothetical protein
MSAPARTVGELLLCLGGPIMWAAHLFGLYGTETLACLDSAARHSAAFQAFATAYTLAAVVTVLGLMAWQAMRGRRRSAAQHQGDGALFLRSVSIVLGCAALVAIAWSALPIYMLPSCAPAAA